LAAVIGSAQDRFHLFTTDDGLPQESVLALLQSRDGYLWFTTYRGIVRFDGVRFRVFDQSNTPMIGTNFVAYNLMEDRDGDIWAGAWSGGAVRYHQGTFTLYTTRDGLPGNTVKRIDQDDQGDIWFYTTRGLARMRSKTGRIEPVAQIDGEDVRLYMQVPPMFGGDTNLFGLWRTQRGATGLQRFARGKWSDIPLPSGSSDLSSLRMEVVNEDPRGRLWFRIMSRPGESYFVENGHQTTYTGLPDGSYGNYLDSLGRVWLTDTNGHTAFWRNGVVTPIPGISTSSPLRVVEDADGSIWAGTLNQGLAHAPVQAISSISVPGGAEANIIRPLLQDRKGDVWIGSYGLNRLHNGHFENFLLPSSMVKWPGDQIVWSLFEDRDGTIFFSNNNGPKIFRDGKIQWPDAPLREIRARVNAYLRDRAGNLWIGTEPALYRYRDSKITAMKSDRGVPLRGEVRALAKDKSGTVWIGTDAVLCNYRAGVMTCEGSPDTAVPWRIRSITADADGVLWIGSAYGGILRVEGDQRFWIQEKQGLYSNDTSGILEDGEGFLWIGSRTGIFRVKKQDLNALARGATDRITSSYFGRRDGLNAADCAGFGQPHGFVARDGSLWFPTADGIARIDPRQKSFQKRPAPVEIESCAVDRHEIACDTRIALRPGAKNLEISYTTPNLLRANQIHFKYHLEGLDPDWVDAGVRRTAFYPYLPPGNFRFQIMAANSFGVWSLTPSELTIAVEPHFYQTKWFMALCVLSMFGVFALLWQWRALQYKRRQALQRAFAQQIIDSQEGERKRIAGELHDGLGQRLTLIKNMAMLLTRRSGEARERQIDAIAEETTQAIAEVRQISRNLRPHRLDLLGLSKSIEALLEETCQAGGLQYEAVVDELSGVFPKSAEIHFYRIVQECLTNAVRHSRATTITLIAQKTDTGVLLVVSDDGVGFNADGAGAPAGFGLTGISERSHLLGGTAMIQSTPGQGTVITIEIKTDIVPTLDKEQGAKPWPIKSAS
jgi:signal transduction histidine kinase/ligand-binding sensor domain-containing protein